MKTYPVIELFGPLSDEQAMREVLSHWASPHQLQQCCRHHAAFVRQDVVMKLDTISLGCIVSYMKRVHPHNEFTHLAAQFLDKLVPMPPKPRIEPRLEPEVRAALSRPAPAVEEAPEEPDNPRWKAKVRFKLHGGRKYSETVFFDEMEELQDVIENGPHWESLKNVKIEMTYLLG